MKEIGSSFLVVLLCILIVGILLAQFSHVGERASRLGSSMKQGETTLEKALNGLSIKLSSLCGDEERLSSVTTTEISHSLSITRELSAMCSVYSLPHLFNTTEMFKSESPCADLEESSFSKTRLAFYLTPSALISSLVCTHGPIGSEKSFITKKNLSISSPLVIARPKVIYVGGYAEFSSIASDKDLLIVSGGDLFVSEFSTNSSPSVSFISATGRVVVTRILGTPKLYIHGPEGAEAPYPISQNGLLPPVKEYIVLGIEKPPI